MDSNAAADARPRSPPCAETRLRNDRADSPPRLEMASTASSFSSFQRLGAIQYRFCTSLRQHVNTVAEREEGIRRYD